MKKSIIFLIIFVTGIFNALYGFGQTVYDGNSSMIIDNKKDIIHVNNNNYKKQLIYEATINAIKQSSPTLINIEEFSIEDFDQMNSNSATDRIIFNSKSGKSVQFQQVGEPVFKKSLRGDNRWECTISGYVVEISNYVPSTTKNIIKKPRKKGDYVFGLNIGLSLPQVFQANLKSNASEILPSTRWDVTIDPIYNFGIIFKVNHELMLGLNFDLTKIKVLTNDNTSLNSNCYGGKIQLGFYKYTINPFISLSGLYGIDNNISFSIKQVGIGIDFLKGRFKIGTELNCFWLSSNYHKNDIQFNNDGIFTINGFKDTRFNSGINIKIYF